MTKRSCKDLWGNQDGAVAVILAFTLVLTLVMATLALDVGRIMVLRNQMQNAADAAVMSGATQLNGMADAIQRATLVAQSTLSQTSGLIGGAELTIASVTFLNTMNPDVAAATDVEAHFMRVTLTPQTLTLLTTPMLNAMSASGTPTMQTVNATAAATTAPIICNAAPFMACDPGEALGMVNSILDIANAGRQIRIKDGGGGAMAPGNFGMLCPADGNCGAASIGDALAATTVPGCYGQNVDTSPGVAMNQIRNGLNARFDQGNRNPHDPARNVINFPMDLDIAADDDALMGNNDWDRDAYWTDKHDGAVLPIDLIAATRYQTYLYELGETYAQSGVITLYPAPSPLPAGFTLVAGVLELAVADDPSDADDPVYDGVPETAPVVDPKRRVVKAAVLNCTAQGVGGAGSYATYGRYIELFVTEMAAAPPKGEILGEIIGPLTEEFATDFHANVKLVE